MSDEKKVIIFNDDSKASQLLFHDLQEQGYKIYKLDIVKYDTLEQWFEEISLDDVKVFLHFTYEQLSADSERLRREIRELEIKGWKNRIVLPYEGMDNHTVEQRYATIKAVPEEIAKQVKKAERIDPDSEMKNAEQSEKPYRVEAEPGENAERLKKPSEGKSRATEKEVVGKTERLYEVKIDNNIDDVMNERKENFKNQRRRKKESPI